MIVIVACFVTALVTILNFGEVLFPPATVTVEGTLATAGSELDKLITAPPIGAAPFKFTVLPAMVFPPATVCAPSVKDAGSSGSIIIVAGAVVPRYVAFKITGVGAVTTDVVILKAFEVNRPAGTFTDTGIVAVAGSSLTRSTVAPLLGAGASRVTVFDPNVPPPTADAAARLNVDTPFGVSVSVPVTEVPDTPTLAVMVTEDCAETLPVVIENGAEMAFAGTITLAGTVTRLFFELVRFTVTPPPGAGEARFTVFPVVDWPPTKLPADKTTDERDGGRTVMVA